MYQRLFLIPALFLWVRPAFSQEKFIPFSDSHIRYEGRIPYTRDAAVLTWPGVSVHLNFVGSKISGTFRDSDTSNYYNIIIDHRVVRKMQFDTTQKSVVLASNLPWGRHSIEVFKRTEWDKGRTWFYGFSIQKGSKVLPGDPPAKRKIEFFGNSITCGYGINDPAGSSPTGFYENNYDAYDAITARHFHADYHCTSKSGIGIMVSWFPLIMPEMYNRLDPTDPDSKWDFSKYTPDLVIINLFQNDSWIVTQPDNAQFKARFGTRAPDAPFIETSYRNFVDTISRIYPHATIICMLGNMDITRKGSPWPGYVSKAVASLHNPRILTFFEPYKNTPGHPRVPEQAQMAKDLISFIHKNLGW
ncbi:MAG: electron transporter RnfD [Bacteroidota bacterium]|nr:electron transporter RnfD [Bacteroidota bacterium]